MVIGELGIRYAATERLVWVRGTEITSKSPIKSSMLIQQEEVPTFPAMQGHLS